MAKISGDSGILSVWDATGEAWRPVSCLTSSSTSSTLAVLESNTKCNPGVTEVSAGALSETIDVEGEYIDTTSVGGDSAKASHDYLKTLQKSREEIEFRFAVDPVETYYGKAFITDLGSDFTAGEIATFSATLRVSGDTTNVDPHAGG